MAAVADPRITLIGGGLGGALLAIYLGRAGRTVDLYERRPDPAAGAIVGGRSINLAISTRGIHALEEVGLAAEVLKLAVPMRGRMIHALGGGLHFQPYDKDPSRHINSVSRAGLNRAMLDAARQHPGVNVHFGWRCIGVDLDAPAADLVHEETREARRVAGDVLIGVDGAFSAVRQSMEKLPRFNFSQHYLGHGYKELTIPPADGGGFRMEPEALHIWPRRSFMMIALPNRDGSFTCTLFYPWEGEHSFASLRTRDDVARFFHVQFPDAVPLMPTLLDDFERNPVGTMVTMRCSPWHYGGKVALLGDAAHAVVPFYGQGANAAFEDCSVLNECIRSWAPDWERVFQVYQSRRAEHVNALADLAIGNFIEMRDHTGSRIFRSKKWVERQLHTLVPEVYTPLYTLISFTRTPYADARRRARWQDRIVAAAAIAITTLALAGLFWFAAPGSCFGRLLLAGVLVGLVSVAVRARLERDRRDAQASGALTP